MPRCSASISVVEALRQEKNGAEVGVVADSVAMLAKHLRWCFTASLSQVTRSLDNPCQLWSETPVYFTANSPQERFISSDGTFTSSIEPINVILEALVFVSYPAINWVLALVHPFTSPQAIRQSGQAQTHSPKTRLKNKDTNQIHTNKKLEGIFFTIDDPFSFIWLLAFHYRA